MKIKITGVLGGIVTFGALAAAPARAQIDTTSRPVVDTIRTVVDTTPKAEPAKDEASKSEPSATSLGKVEGGVRLQADLSTRTLTIMGANGAIRTFNIAVGQPSYPTPPGTYTISKIVWNPSWIPPDAKWAQKYTPKGPGEPGNPMKVAKIYFREPAYYIHGTADINSLGSAESHGCLRMDPNEVAELAQFLMENGGAPREEGWFSRVMHMRWKTHTVYLSQPITLTVTR